VIETARLVLRLPRAEDAAEALLMLQDQDTARWNAVPAVVDLQSAVAWLARGADWATADHCTWSLVDKATGGFVGSVSLHSINPEQLDAEIGYRVAPAARGRRIAAEAVDAASAWAFAERGLMRIELVHAVPNAASCRVALRAGFRLEAARGLPARGRTAAELRLRRRPTLRRAPARAPGR
jgi:RimJ/RimL family protein N-acetyltransferase